MTSRYQRKIPFRDLSLDQKFEIIDQLLKLNDLFVIIEETPDYVAVTLGKEGGDD